MTRAQALWVIAGVFLALFWPCLVRGWVLYPHDNALEMGASPETPDRHRSNRKFSDTSSFYVPELHEHLRGDHTGGLATWAPLSSTKPRNGTPTCWSWASPTGSASGAISRLGGQSPMS